MIGVVSFSPDYLQTIRYKFTFDKFWYLSPYQEDNTNT